MFTSGFFEQLDVEYTDDRFVKCTGKLSKTLIETMEFPVQYTYFVDFYIDKHMETVYNLDIVLKDAKGTFLQKEDLMVIFPEIREIETSLEEKFHNYLWR